jgi:hypothetical protein
MKSVQTIRKTWMAMVALLFGAILVIAAPASGSAGPAAELWPRWLAHDPSSTASIDHSAWKRFLSRYLVESADGINRVRYAEVEESDRHALAAYIEALAAVPISGHSRDEQIAYWANLYNALTVKVVLDHYPVDSIRDINISPGLFSRGPWGRKLVMVEGEALSLDDIEHRIMRPIWQDPRIHYMVNCAALGCPNLLPQPFTGETWDAMASLAAKQFINHPRGARVDNGRLNVSSIYHWYMEDFGNSDSGVISHLSAYAEEALASDLLSIERIHRHDYDWALHDVRGQAAIN